ncbi:MAG: hypothetical protein J6R32_09355 [Bacteroidales bacterium]|nr:hypothetical protein [Bacteroidales bacterium]
MAHISDGGQIVFDADATCYIAPVELGLAYSSNSSKCAFFTALPALNSVAYDSASHEIEDNQVLSPIDGYIVCEFQKELPIINNGKTLQPYEPYDMIKIPVVCAGQTSDIYIDDVLRKSSGQDPVYDILYSDGTLTRNVDTDGTPLQEPTTETFEPVIINTVFGSNTLTVDTTVKPSSVSIEYYDN